MFSQLSLNIVRSFTALEFDQSLQYFINSHAMFISLKLRTLLLYGGALCNRYRKGYVIAFILFKEKISMKAAATT